MTVALSPENLRAFAASLTASQKKLFGKLKELMAHRESKLTWYRRAGSKLCELQEAVHKRGPGWQRQLAGALGLSKSSLTKMRKFAGDFNWEQTKRLDQIGLGRGMVIVVQHVSTGDPMKLLEEAANQNWTAADLLAVVRQRFGVRNRGGRPLRKPRTVTEALVQLQAHNQRWLRFHRQVWAGGAKSLRDRLPDLPSREMRQLKTVLAELKGTMHGIQRVCPGGGEAPRRAGQEGSTILTVLPLSLPKMSL